MRAGKPGVSQSFMKLLNQGGASAAVKDKMEKGRKQAAGRLIRS